MKNTLIHEIQQEKGTPSPLGVSRVDNGINFSLFSQNATGVMLCLYSTSAKHPFAEIPLEIEMNRTGEIWHISLKKLPEEHIEYGYRITGPIDPLKHLFNSKITLSDPYARSINSSSQWGNKTSTSSLGKIILDAPFDWQNVQAPQIAMENVIIYEMHVRSFTHHPSSHTKAPGTFLAIIEKIPYLKKLGINAIELLPIFEFDECHNSHICPKTKQPLKNVWGYSTINFFSPMNRYATSSGWTAAIDEFRTMVREMHRNGIEVYLDVVYNHTAEGDLKGPYYSFRGIDNSIYYILDSDGQYIDYSGTGNTFNTNHPIVSALVLDSLRYWVKEMHVDGFRFDLASCMTRGLDGTPLIKPPMIEAITSDPILNGVKLIAEAWDCGGLYQVGSFPCADGRWSEWNGKYRDIVRQFIKGTDAASDKFAKVMTGSQFLYGHNRLPYHSINFITAHDGFSLCDLVSYQEKHNEDNGEGNRDGTSDNESWNCGHEGETDNHKILLLRERQIRNFHVSLMVALGTPMILMGDEYGHTRNGNNNAYCQDNELNWFLWDALKKHEDFTRFHRLMIQFRKQNPLLMRKDFLTDMDVEWHGLVPLKANWGSENRFLAYTLKDPLKSESLYIAFNANFQKAHIQFPIPPEGKKWYLIVDTALDSPHDFCEDPKKMPPLQFTYNMADHSSLIAKAL